VQDKPFARRVKGCSVITEKSNDIVALLAAFT